MLWEVGHPQEPLLVLNEPPQDMAGAVAFGLTRAEADAATGHYAGAPHECQKGTAKAPQDPRIRRRNEGTDPAG